MKVEENQVDNLHVKKYDSRQALGQDAARLVGEKLLELQRSQKVIHMIFASAPSQNEFLENLIKFEGIDWEKIVAFHMDEYIGLSTEHDQSFGYFLRKKLFDFVPISQVHYIHGDAADMQQECKRYEALLKDHPIDIVCMGIGENTHIAFNDPHVADFNDKELVKIIDLDIQSRQQQVNDDCFASIELVPTHAVTLTIPALFAGQHLFCMVPGSNKARAVYHTLNETISADFPATVLRKHADAILFVDDQSGAQIP